MVYKMVNLSISLVILHSLAGLAYLHLSGCLLPADSDQWSDCQTWWGKRVWQHNVQHSRFSRAKHYCTRNLHLWFPECVFVFFTGLKLELLTQYAHFYHPHDNCEHRHSQLDSQVDKRVQCYIYQPSSYRARGKIIALTSSSCCKCVTLLPRHLSQEPINVV